jgi:hypothetical protein
MRTTKALLLTAAISAAGVVSSMAQVYSVNVVGFVNMSLPAGFSLIANPLKATNDFLSAIIPTAPDGTQVLTFNVTNQTFAADVPSYIEGFGWFPDGEVKPGQGFFINLPSATTLTFVGEVRQGNLSAPIATGYSIQSSQVPQRGLVTTDLTLPATDGDQIFRWDRATQTYFSEVPGYIEGFGWFPSEPMMEIGESFFLLTSAAKPWTRTFNVGN